MLIDFLEFVSWFSFQPSLPLKPRGFHERFSLSCPIQSVWRQFTEILGISKEVRSQSFSNLIGDPSARVARYGRSSFGASANYNLSE